MLLSMLIRPMEALRSQTARWCATFLGLLVAGALLLVPLYPFITQETWPQQYEIGFHHISMRAWWDWLQQGRTIGWDHTFFNGHPLFQFYFPMPAIGWGLLQLVLPAHTAFIVVVVLPIPGMLWAAFWLGRTWFLSRPSAAAFACVVVFAWGEWAAHSAYIPGVRVALYGPFSHGWAMVAALLTLGATNRALSTTACKRGRLLTAGTLLSACTLSHPLVGIPVGLSLLTLARRNSIKRIAMIGGIGLGLSAWWWVPSVGHVWMAHSLHLPKMAVGHVFRWEILACAPFAAWGMWRLSKRVPNRRTLLPIWQQRWLSRWLSHTPCCCKPNAAMVGGWLAA